MHDGTWTTDRARAADRWSQIEPEMAADLRELLAGSDGAEVDPTRIRHAVTVTVPAIVQRFEAET